MIQQGCEQPCIFIKAFGLTPGPMSLCYSKCLQDQEYYQMDIAFSVFQIDPSKIEN